MISLQDIKIAAAKLLHGIEDGAPLDAKNAAVIAFSVHAAVTSLDREACIQLSDDAIAAGASAEELHEALVLVSALGVHSLMEFSPLLLQHLRRANGTKTITPLNKQQQKIWNEYVGDDPYWVRMEELAPGFLGALLRFSPEAFEGFFRYCALPWRSGLLPALTKELIAMACDASTSHRYLPGLRLHVANAIKLGAGKSAILQTLDIAAKSSAHQGVA